jgi:hypothetical protein
MSYLPFPGLDFRHRWEIVVGFRREDPAGVRDDLYSTVTAECRICRDLAVC